MAALSPTFRTDSKRIHEDHEAITQELEVLEASLEQLSAFADEAANPGALERVRLYSQRLMAQLPEHCVREEFGLLETVAGVSAELKEFSRQMKQQHSELMGKLYAFAQAVSDLEDALDPAAATDHLVAQGREFCRAMRAHMALEEHTLSGFL
jgi:hemerythrin-like domain-containing protein